MEKEFQPLRLKAIDAEDLKVISACLQDALVSIGDMAYLSEEHRFVLVGSRFIWEKLVRQPPQSLQEAMFERIMTGLMFDHVQRVRKIGFEMTPARHSGMGGESDVAADREDEAKPPLSLLAIEVLDTPSADMPPGRIAIQLTFAGNAAIRVEVDQILCHLQDIGEAWSTSNRPDHGAAM